MLLSSEEDAAQVAEAAGERRLAGEFARLLDVRISPPERGGLWDLREPGEKRSGEALAEQLSEYAERAYGAPLRAWVEWLQSQPARWLRERVKMLANSFRDKAASGSSPVTRRAAKKFGVIYAALRLTHRAGVTPWSRKQVLTALLASFARSLGPTEEEARAQLIGELRAALAEPNLCPSLSEANAISVQGAAAKARWIGVRGVPYKGTLYLALRERGLEAKFGKAKLTRMLAALDRLGLTNSEAGGSRWLVRIGAGEMRCYRVALELIDKPHLKIK